MANPAHYLLPTERPVINIRRHWAVLAGNSIQSLLLLVLGILVVRVGRNTDFVQMIGIYFCVFVVARWAWIIGDWYVEKLIVTDKRVLLLTGIVTRKVAIMPLVKVTDLTYNRSTTGLLLGYGQFVVETAGQDQALSTIDFVPRPELLYMQISELLFGGDKGAPGALVTSAQRAAEEEAERAARRRWRRFSPRRRRREAEDRGPGPRPEPVRTTSRLDDLLARRDTLLADREDPDYPDYPGDDRDRPYRETDRGFGRDRDFDLDFRGDRGRRDGRDGFGDEGSDDDRYRRPDPTIELPRIHEPPRGDSGRGEGRRSDDPFGDRGEERRADDRFGDRGEGRRFDDRFGDRGEGFRSEELPPSRRPRDEPPPPTVDPADD